MIFAAKGYQVAEELRRLKETEWYDGDDLRNLQFRKLTVILHHAYENVLHYRKAFDQARVHPRDIRSPDDLERLPYLEKETLNRKPVESFLSEMNPRGHSIRRTSGTTGRPVVVYRDQRSEACALAARYRSEGWFGLEIGDRQARFWGRSLSGRSRIKERLLDGLLNRVRFSSSQATELEMEKLRRVLSRFRPVHYYGYTSLLVRYADFLGSRRRGGHSGIKAVVTTAERLHRYQRSALKRVFDAPIADEYGSSETEIIAFECPEGNRHIISENVLVEVVKDTDRTEEAGEIVVTDLNNRLMPLIRYRLGDRGIIGDHACPCGRGLPILKEIQGRTSEVQYLRTPDGRVIHSVVFAYLFEDMADLGIRIAQYRAIQETIEDVRVLIVAAHLRSDERASASRLLKNGFLNCLGEDMKLSIEFVNSIPEEDWLEKHGYFESKI
jgi:phenylacetate-CoA ligase